MKKITVCFALVCSFALNASDKSDYVEVTLNQGDSDGAITLTCVPKLEMEHMPKSWVKICNQQGHVMLQNANENGQNLKVTEKPFGMAGDFAQQMSEDLPKNVKPSSITSVDLSIR